MTEGARLPDAEVAIHLKGFRSSIGRAGVKIDVHLPRAAVEQLLEYGVTGGVAGSNLRVDVEDVELRDGSGPLGVVEIIVAAEGASP